MSPPEPTAQVPAGRGPRVLRPTSLAGTLLAMVPPAVCAVAGWLAWGGLLDGAILGVLAWFVLRFVLVRQLLTRHHQRGTRLAREGQWEAALQAYAASEALWAGHPLLDRWRAPLLGTAARWPYRVLALYNQALCLAELQRTDEALALLARVERLSPGLPPARELRAWLATRQASAPVEQPAEGAGWFDPEELA